jgi:hypothetical protein
MELLFREKNLQKEPNERFSNCTILRTTLNARIVDPKHENLVTFSSAF